MGLNSALSKTNVAVSLHLQIFMIALLVKGEFIIRITDNNTVSLLCLYHDLSAHWGELLCNCCRYSGFSYHNHIPANSNCFPPGSQLKPIAYAKTHSVIYPFSSLIAPADFPNWPPRLIPNFNGHVFVGTEHKAMGSSQESFMVWGSGFCFPASQRDFCRANAPFPEPAALHWGPKFLPAFPLEQRPSLAFKMPGRPQLCSQPLLAAARGSPRRRRALTQPQSGCSTEQDLESACPEPPGKHRSLDQAAGFRSWSWGLARMGPPCEHMGLARPGRTAGTSP